MTERQSRLMAIAFCERIISSESDPKIQHAIEMAKLHVEGHVTPGELYQAAVYELYDPWAQKKLVANGREVRAIAACCVPYPGYTTTFRTSQTARLAKYRVQHAEGTATLARQVYERNGNKEPHLREAMAQALIIQDIVQPPSESRQFEQSWLNSDVISLAEHMYEMDQFEALPILGDALEEAGCDDEHILEHCRNHPFHVRGCWVIDGILGKFRNDER